MINRQVYVGITLVLLGLASLACSIDFDAKDDTTDIQSKPIVRLLAPVNNSIYAEGVEVQLYAIAQDSLAGVARIEFRLDDLEQLGAIFAENPAGEPSLEARIAWTATGKQAHQLIVEAFRADESSLGESAVIITVTDQPTARVLAGDTTAAPLATLPPASANVTPEDTATPVPTPTERPVDIGIISGPTARVTVAELPVRQGPGTTFPPVGILLLDDIVQIVGRNEDSSWWAIAYGDGTAWVLASQVMTEGDVGSLPLVAPPQ
jgi:hypothetical protein